MPGKMHMNCGMGMADSFDQLRTPRDLLVKFQDFLLFQCSSVLSGRRHESWSLRTIGCGYPVMQRSGVLTAHKRV